jgi:serine/threonine protein kinase
MTLPTQLGRYPIVGRLASGGMAEILLGKALGPNGFERPVVIKRILPHLARQESFVKMFLDEASVVSRIQHPNVVHVHELGQTTREGGEDLYLVMEYLAGESCAGLLRRSVARAERIPYAVAAHIVAECCSGLHAAHELADENGRPLQLVHRDVSPPNVFVTYDGAVKLLDFGIAKFASRSTETEAGTLKGKFSYMSPEQCHSPEVDRRSDLFSLGVVLFELSVQRKLFARETSLQTMAAICSEPIPPPNAFDPDYPDALARICAKALARDPAQRFQTAAEMRRALVAAMRTLGASELPDEALAAIMKRSFTDRAIEKRELLRRVSAGSEITTVPPAEADSSFELPPAPSWRAPRATAKKKLWVGLAVAATALVALLAVGGVVIALQGPSGEERASEVRRADDPPVRREPAGAVQIVAAPPAPLPVTARLRIVTHPEGATVRVRGEERGTTPIDLEMTRSDDPLAIEIAHPGYSPWSESVTLDADRTVDVWLSPARTAATRSAARAASMTEPTESAMSGSPFRRFR